MMGWVGLGWDGIGAYWFLIFGGDWYLMNSFLALDTCYMSLLV
jgi:hypothetical protein